MKVDLPISDSWHAINDRAREYLGVADSPDVSVHVYLGVRHALWEITQSLAHTFAHRRTLGYTPFTGPEGEFIALEFAKEGYTVKSLTPDEFENPKAWLETAGKQMLCLLSAFDDPVTGELYQTESHVSAMKDQRIFRILISHSYHHHYQLGKVGPYDIQILSIDPELAFVVLGERAKFIPPISTNLGWNNLSFDFSEKMHSKTESPASTTPEQMSEFKKSVPEGFEIFKTQKLSLPDRVLLLSNEVEGLSLATRVAEILGEEIPEQGQDGKIETLSLCRWQDPRQLEWLAQKGLTIEKLRGSLLLSSKLIFVHGAKKVSDALARARNELLAEQG